MPGKALALQRIRELRAAVADLLAAHARASQALDSALINIAAREAEWPAREQRAIEQGRAIAACLLRQP